MAIVRPLVLLYKIMQLLLLLSDKLRIQICIRDSTRLLRVARLPLAEDRLRENQLLLLVAARHFFPLDSLQLTAFLVTLRALRLLVASLGPLGVRILSGAVLIGNLHSIFLSSAHFGALLRRIWLALPYSLTRCVALSPWSGRIVAVRQILESGIMLQQIQFPAALQQLLRGLEGHLRVKVLVALLFLILVLDHSDRRVLPRIVFLGEPLHLGHRHRAPSAVLACLRN